MVSRLWSAIGRLWTERLRRPFVILLVILPFLLAADEQESKLDGPTKAKVYAALAGLVILWVLVIVLIALGANFTRRYMKSPFDGRPSVPPDGEDDWAKTPLNKDDG